MDKESRYTEITPQEAARLWADGRRDIEWRHHAPDIPWGKWHNDGISLILCDKDQYRIPAPSPELPPDEPLENIMSEHGWQLRLEERQGMIIRYLKSKPWK